MCVPTRETGTCKVLGVRRQAECLNRETQLEGGCDLEDGEG